MQYIPLVDVVCPAYWGDYDKPFRVHRYGITDNGLDRQFKIFRIEVTFNFFPTLESLVCLYILNAVLPSCEVTIPIYYHLLVRCQYMGRKLCNRTAMKPPEFCQKYRKSLLVSPSRNLIPIRAICHSTLSCNSFLEDGLRWSKTKKKD